MKKPTKASKLLGHKRSKRNNDRRRLRRFHKLTAESAASKAVVSNPICVIG